MTDIISHRGPDDSGTFSDGRAFLGHRRLSIIDIKTGHQPMSNESGSSWIVYNGEIFNHAQLRADLERAGHVYRSRSDTETILHAHEQWGPACLDRFRGMFAFAIWDQRSGTLFCARDRLGIKPFYYYWDGCLFAFASEIKAILEYPSISAKLDESQLPECLAFGYLSGEQTMFRGIRKLMPGHHLTLNTRTDGLSIQRYWDVPAWFEESPRPESDWVVETRQRLEETSRMRLMSDVPLGVFLSGGVDSSAIAAIVKRTASGSVKTFAVGYDDQRFSELSYAAQAARAIGTEHHEVVIGMQDFFDALPRLVWHEDEPVTWPSSVSLYFVSRLAASQVKVVLTGEGSDELFAGYERYRWNFLNQRGARIHGILPGSMRRAMRSWLASSSLLGANLRRQLRHTFLGRENSVESLFLDNFYCAFSRQEQALLSEPAHGSAYGNYMRYWNARPADPLLPRMLYADQKTYLVELLMKQDQMSMACSIESRVPFLDHTFVEFAMRIPAALKIRGSVHKHILKKAVEDLLPPEITYRKKMGFPTPIRKWLLDPRAEALYSAVLDPNGFLASYLDLGPVSTLIERHRAGREDATDQIWRLINLQLWGDLFITGRREHWWNGCPIGGAA
jgi:asparagine synthase (glutamine-hydrolysing)